MPAPRKTASFPATTTPERLVLGGETGNGELRSMTLVRGGEDVVILALHNINIFMLVRESGLLELHMSRSKYLALWKNRKWLIRCLEIDGDVL